MAGVSDVKNFRSYWEMVQWTKWRARRHVVKVSLAESACFVISTLSCVGKMIREALAALTLIRRDGNY